MFRIIKDKNNIRSLLPVRLKVYWAVGSLGLMSVSYTVITQLSYFMVEYLGISAVLAGVVFAVSRAYDAFTDPLVGLLSDKTQSRWGRRRPWILASAFVVPIACLIMFHPPDLPLNWLIGFMIIGVLLFYSGFTMYFVPHLAMAAEMTDSYQERTSLMAYNMFFSAVAGFIGISVSAWLIIYFGNDRSAFGYMSIPIAILSFFCLYLCFYGTSSARMSDTKIAKKLSVKEWVTTLINNKPFAILVTAKLFHLFGIGSVSASIPFFSATVLGYGQSGLATFGIGINLGQVLALPLWVWLGKFIPKHHLYALAVLWFGLVCLTFLIIDTNTPIEIFFFQTLFLGFAAAGILTMGQSLLPDVVAYDRALTGLRREAMFTAVFSFMQKTAQSISPLAVGLVLSMTGYVSGMEGVQQGEEAARGVYIAVGIVPAVALSCSIPFLLIYDLTEKKLKDAGVA